MFHGGAKYSTDNVRCSKQVLNIPRGGSNVPRMCQTHDGECQLFHGGAKYSTDNVKCSKQASIESDTWLTRYPRSQDPAPHKSVRIRLCKPERYCTTALAVTHEYGTNRRVEEHT